MARLGRSLPSEQARRLVLQRLRPGTIIHLLVTFPETRLTKEKFLVFAGHDGEHCYFIVNSKIHRLIQKNADLLRCQVLLDAANHEFLDHDSYVSCDKVLRISESEIVASLCDDLTRIKGTISEAVRDQIISAVKHAVTLSAKLQNMILENLRSPSGNDD